MAQIVTIESVTANTPVNIYYCDAMSANCQFVSSVSTFPYSFTVPSPLADSNFIVKIIDCYNCIVGHWVYVIPTPTPTITPTSGLSPTPTQTNTATPTNTITSSITPTPTKTPTGTPIVTPTRTPAMTPLPPCTTQTPTTTPGYTPSNTPTNTETPTNTPSNTPTETPTETPTNTPTETPTNTPTNTETPTPTVTETPTQTSTQTPTVTPTISCECHDGTINDNNSFSYYNCNGILQSGGGELGSTICFDINKSYSLNITDNGVSITCSCNTTPTPTPTVTDTPTNTPSQTQTETPTNTPSETPTNTPTNTPSETPTNTPTNTPSETPTNTPTNTSSETPTNTPTNTPSETPTNTPTNTPSQTQTETPTNTPSETPTNTPTNTPSETPTNTPSETPTNTPTNSPTNTPSESPTQTPTNTPTNTITPTMTPTNSAVISNIDVLFLDGNTSKVYSYNPISSAITYLFSATTTGGFSDIAATQNRIFLSNNDGGNLNILVYSYTSSPFSYSYISTKTFVGIVDSTGLTAKDNDTLIVGYVSDSKIDELNLNTLATTTIFNLPTDNFTTGDIVYNSGTTQYAITYFDNITFDNYAGVFNSSGTLQYTNILLSQPDMYGIYAYNNKLWGVDANLNIYFLNFTNGTYSNSPTQPINYTSEQLAGASNTTTNISWSY